MKNSIARRLFILTVLLGASFVCLSFLLQAFDGWKMRTIARDLTTDRRDRFETTFHLLGQTPEAMCLDYSMWDDTVAFVKSVDLKWAAENVDTILERFKVTAAQIYDAQGRLVYVVDVAGKRGHEHVRLSPEVLEAALSTSPTAVFFEGTERGVYQVFVARITRTEDVERKQRHGYLVTAVLMDTEYLKGLEVLAGGAVTLVSAKSGATLAAAEPPEGSTRFLRALEDYTGHRLGYLSVVQTIPGYDLVGKASSQAKVTVALFALAVFTVLSWFLRGWVARPLTAVSAALRQNDIEPIDQLTDENSEFGAMARLVVQFFEQKATLLEEVQMRQQAETELAAARDHALALATSKSQFLANMSHEIRTPMNGVIGICELLASTELDPRQREYVETMRNSSDTLLTVINDVLEFSKLEAGRVQLESEPFDFLETAERVCTLFAQQAKAKGVELVVNPGLGLAPMYLGDSLRLSQVLSNLIGNAIKFTERGSVVVALEDLPGPDGTRWVQGSVRDTGIGIAHDRQQAVFTNFAQADLGTTRKYGGTGLGLSICKLIVECMGGQIGLESVPNLGSTFWFRIPLQAADGPQAQPFDKTQLAGKLALIIDPSEVSRVALARRLAAWDIRVETAPTAEDAWSRLGSGQRRIDFVVADVQMPGLDVSQLVDWASGVSELGQPVGVVLMGDSPQAGSENGAPRCMVRVVGKPVRRMPLYEALLGPRIEVESSTAAPAPTVEHPSAYGLTVLLAEDNPVNTMVAVRMLEKLGCTVDVATNGLEATEMAQERDYDVVFMDVHMPEMGGFEATKIIRDLERGTWRRRTIVAMTADAMEGDREACLAAGMDDYVSKPISIAALDRVLSSWTGHRKAA